MRGVWVNSNGLATKGLAELNHQVWDEQEARDGLAGDAQGLSEEDESRINESSDNASHGPNELVWPLAIQQRPQQQPQGTVVQWERFLRFRSLKVLLVENDVSTRQIVSSLLRNCSYEVTAAANGIEAWKILEDLTNDIDLVLAEVVMPCLSGIGLLCKIMSHKTCKNIPVIMMSSNDSMGIAFKCLSEGAVDFLVKPIRKNELKNLWQHIWRKCHSSSGSGSGSESDRISVKSRGIDLFDNHTGSTGENDNTYIGVNVIDGSDKGRGTQSSWIDQPVEDDSPQPISPWDQLGDPLDSTCACVIHSRPEASANIWVSTTSSKEYRGQDDEDGNVAVGKYLEMVTTRYPDLQLGDQDKTVSAIVAGTEKENFSDIESKKDGEKLEKERLEFNSETSNGESRNGTVDPLSALTNCTYSHMNSVATGVPDDISRENIKDKAIYDTKEMPFLELSLKRRRDVEEIGTSYQDQNVLRHSELSAFSRYNTTSNARQGLHGNVGSCSPLENSLEAAKTMHNRQYNSNGIHKQGSNGSSNSNDMGCTSNNTFTTPEVFTDNPMAISVVNTHPSSSFHPVQTGHAFSLQSVMPPQIQVHHHHHHHVHNIQQLPNRDDLSLRTTAVAASYCWPSNLSSMPIEDNAANSSLNGSASGSSNWSSKQNGSRAAVTTEGTNTESDKWMAASGGGSRSGVDQNHFTQRQAALNKFRQKRKERCFTKKVRYQSRKQLAEQRPRVRGQFIRKLVYENKIKDKDC